jgi:periplasmic divalent cation tolerance protein
MPSDIHLVFITWPDLDAARAAARVLVGEKLAACANLIPAVESIYRWEGQVETAGEVLMIVKTTGERFAELAARVRTLHRYEVPEIVTFPLSDGLPAYLRWVAESCAP